jgi:hypothetical protein
MKMKNRGFGVTEILSFLYPFLVLAVLAIAGGVHIFCGYVR